MEEDSGYLILRKKSYWDYNHPVFYPGNKNPYKILLSIGKKVIFEKELDGEIKFIGYGEIDSIEKIPPEQSLFGPDYNTIVRFKNYVHFFPPRMKNQEIRKKLLDLPYYKWYGAIRPIPVDIFYDVIEFCLNPNWALFLDEMQSSHSQKSIDDILSENESEVLEFKSSMLHLTQKPNYIIPERSIQTSNGKRFDIERNKTESNLKEIIQKEIAITISAFLNTNGGTLIVGVNDDHNVIGIENDYNELSKKKDWDGWFLHLRNLIEKYIDKLVSQQLNVKAYIKKGKTIARIDVPISTKPVYIKQGNEREFYIRSFNASLKLDIENAVNYVKTKWNK